jgi:peptidoglycan/xylan/chitin deacetylase (PgdA/CDA1 family)
MRLTAALNNRFTAWLPVNPAANRAPAPLASFTFDDFPRSAWTAGGALLREYGAKATFYAVGSYAGRVVEEIEQYRASDLQEIVAEGHEVASHTFSHRPVYQMSAAALRADEEANAAFLRSQLGDYRASGFAYPYGQVSPRTKALFGRLYPVSRGIRPGVNGRLLDLAQLAAVPLESRSWRARDVEAYVVQAAAQRGWLIFFTHDISDTPSPYGATPAMLAHALSAVKAAGIEILPVKHALARTQFG